MTTAGIQAPIVNFETTTTRSTMPVAVAPMALIVMATFQRGAALAPLVHDHAASGRA